MVRQLERAESIVYEGGLIGTVGLLTAPQGEALQIADVSTWDVRMYETGSFPGDERRLKRPIYQELGVLPASANTNVGLPLTPLIVSDNPVRSDGFWDGPPPGYNFLHFIRPGDLSAFAPPTQVNGGRLYVLEYLFTTVWDQILLEHYLTAKGKRSG